ncbi:hypothetical protein HK105_205789 [Polyrhizophydium stewartii]|uniref:Uncharacterized protein n=1 Tax=Polyrhizophydium stewartii TaxID=2732419 RepID=A0ABR4N563_9FUNG|nr:hypothetical protein HK105_007921 [Polyrhizophydium stewartii]
MPYTLRSRKPESTTASSPTATSPKSPKGKAPASAAPNAPSGGGIVGGGHDKTRGSASPKAAAASRNTTKTDFKTLHQKVVADIARMGPAVSQLAHRKTFAATSKVAKKHQAASAVSARVIRAAASGIDPETARLKVAVNAQVKNRAVLNQIKSLGAKPINLLTKNSVRRGVPVGFVTGAGASGLGAGRVSKKLPPIAPKPAGASSAGASGSPTRKSPMAVSPTRNGNSSASASGGTNGHGASAAVSPTGERITKSISAEIRKFGVGTPSSVKARTSVAATKTAVNTEVLKRAAVQEIKQRRPTSPIKSPAKAPLKRPRQASPKSPGMPSPKAARKD